MKLLLYVALIFIFIFCMLHPVTRTILLNPFLTLFHLCVDLFHYFKYRLYNRAECGHIIAFTGLFGKGKTLSCSREVIRLYRRFNGKKFYDSKRGKWVTQNVIIVSNVCLNDIPYVSFESLGQLLQIASSAHAHDAEHDLHTVIYVLADEMSVMLNSRSFKDNFNALSLAMLLQSRKYSMSIFYTAQRFNQCDALLRQVTEYVYECNKHWRIQVLEKFDGYELENCANPQLVKSLGKIGYFVLNRDYSAYDTSRLADVVKTSCDKGDMLTDLEILNLQSNNISDGGVTKPSRKFKKLHKR